mmetsp:Transcript_9913/g.25588  ORF Transcript_9913/g.25588 Transcript_9913/m.25588 type:complete len:200 (+) Transcript_9913:1065-1664(+)
MRRRQARCSRRASRSAHASSDRCSRTRDRIRVRAVGGKRTSRPARISHTPVSKCSGPRTVSISPPCSLVLGGGGAAVLLPRRIAVPEVAMHTTLSCRGSCSASRVRWVLHCALSTTSVSSAFPPCARPAPFVVLAKPIEHTAVSGETGNLPANEPIASGAAARVRLRHAVCLWASAACLAKRCISARSCASCARVFHSR